jgi:hypothetical protein
MTLAYQSFKSNKFKYILWMLFSIEYVRVGFRVHTGYFICRKLVYVGKQYKAMKVTNNYFDYKL